MVSRSLFLFFALFFLLPTTHAQEITVFPGFWGMDYYQDENEITKGEVAALMSNDAEANHLWKKANTHNTVAWIALGAEVGFLVWQLKRASNNESQTGPLIGVLGTAIVGLGFSLSSSSLRKKAILKYNKNLDRDASLNLGATYNGVGLVYQF